MVELDDERDPVHVAARHHAERAQGRGHRVALTGQGQLHQVGRIEVGRVLGEAGRGGVLDPLVDREDGQVPGAAQPPVVVHAAHVAQHGGRAIGVAEHPAQVVGSRQDEALGWKGFGRVAEQGISLVAQEVMEIGTHACSLTEPPPQHHFRGRGPPGPGRKAPAPRLREPPGAAYSELGGYGRRHCSRGQLVRPAGSPGLTSVQAAAPRMSSR